MEETKGRILCVDNDVDTCEMVRFLLSKAGYEVAIAPTVREGLRLAKNDSCDLILVDWHFEDGTGIELCQKIRKFDNQTPILFYTGVAFDSNISEAMRAGAQGYLIKPVDVDTLLQSVSGHVSKDGSSQGSRSH